MAKKYIFGIGESGERRRRLRRQLAHISQRLRPDTDNSQPRSSTPFSTKMATWVGIGSAIIGGFLGLDTYRADVGKKVNQSVEKTFEMIHRFNEPQMAEPRLRVLSYVDARRQCDSRIMSRELVDNDFITVIDFFDLVHACVEAGLCDHQTAEQFFAPYANYQWPVLSRNVRLIRERKQSLRNDTAFSVGIQKFAIDPVTAPPCNGNF